MEINSTTNVSHEIEISSSKLNNQPLIGLIVLYSLTTFLSIVGNIFVIIVFKSKRHAK